MTRPPLERLREAVISLHCPDVIGAVVGDCSLEDCDHEEACPEVPTKVCRECFRIAETSYSYFGEEGLSHVLWPCPTVALLDEATS